MVMKSAKSSMPVARDVITAIPMVTQLTNKAHVQFANRRRSLIIAANEFEVDVGSEWVNDFV